jgi:hypothetical protein
MGYDSIDVDPDERREFQRFMSRRFSRENLGNHDELDEVREDLTSNDRRKIAREKNLERPLPMLSYHLYRAEVVDRGIYYECRFSTMDADPLRIGKNSEALDGVDEQDVPAVAFMSTFQ